MGLVSGLISAPCTGPVLLSLLAFIATSAADGGGVVYGGSLLFAYALGMGTLFFAVALGASLFRPGAWMEHVKSFFGVAMLVMAAWFLRPVHKALADFTLDPSWGLWAGLGLVAFGIAAGAVHLSFKSGKAEAARKAVAVGVAAFGGIVALNNVLYVPPMEWNEVATLDELTASIEQAEADGKPILIDFAATWCLPCQEMEKLTFHHADVEPRLAKDFHLIKIDVTDPSDEQDKMKGAFDSGTLPSILLYSGDAGLSSAFDALREGKAMPPAAAHFKSFVEADAFGQGLDKAQ